MSIVSHVKLQVLEPQQAGEEMVTKWLENLKANAERLNEMRKAIVKDEESFQRLFAGASQKLWPAFINPAYLSKSGLDADQIIEGRLKNLKEAFELYSGKLDAAFATVDGIPAKRFKEAVERAREAFSKGIAKRTLPMTGDRRAGRGPAAIAAYWLVDDNRVEEYLRAGDDVLQGGPIRVCLPRTEAVFKTALTGRIIQAGAFIIKRERNAAEITKQNDQINHLVQSLVDPGLGLTPFATGGLSHVDFIVDHGELYLEIQVDQI